MRGDITKDSADIINHYQHCYANTLDNLNKGKITPKIQTTKAYSRNKLNSPISTQEIKQIKCFPHKNLQVQMASLVNSAKH